MTDVANILQRIAADAQNGEIVFPTHAQIALRVPFDFTRAFQGILLIAILIADSLVTYRLRISAGRRAAA